MHAAPRALILPWLSIVLFIFAPLAAAAQADEQAQAIAFGYFRQARSLADQGAWSQAKALLEVSLEFSPSFSESCYLYGRILLRDQETTRAGISWLRRAVADGSWSETDPEEAGTELARVLLRTRQYDQARSELAGLSGGPSSPGLGARDNPDAALLWGLAQSGLGDLPGAGRYLGEALKRYPADRRLYLHLARTLRALGRTAEALTVLGRGRRELPQAPELSLEAARYETERPRRLELVKEHFQRGGSDASAAALALALEPNKADQHLERFFQLGGNARMLPLAGAIDYYRTRSGKQAEALLAAVQGYTGVRTVDAEEDGFYEEQYRYAQGALETWVLDRDQDGVSEAEARFAEGALLSFSLPSLEFRYSAYPFLKEVAVRDEQRLRVYAVQPYQIRLFPFAGTPVVGAPVRLGSLRLILREQVWPDEEKVRALSPAMTEYAHGSSAPERFFSLYDGKIQRMEEMPDGQGRFTHVVEYAQGSPLAGRRDLDGDGLFEIREEYIQGRLAALSLDQDGDGRPELRQQFGPSGTRSLWDYNGDGTTDSSESAAANGEVLREFSTRLDGNFDARATFRSGVLIRFQRSGRSLPVMPAPGATLYWIGRPGVSVEPFLSLTEGLHRVGGREYFVFIYQGRRYIEPL